MAVREQQQRGLRERAAAPATTTGAVPVGRYTMDLHGQAGSTLWKLPRAERAEPPTELVQALERSDDRPGRLRRVAAFLDRSADQVGAITAKVDRPGEILRSVLEGRLPEAGILSEELADLFGWADALVKAERFEDAIRLARPLCRLFGLTLRWARMYETLRLVLHAGTALADSRTVAWAEHELGALHLAAGDPNGAREHLERARKLRRQLDDQEGLAATDHNLGLLPSQPWLPPFSAALIALVMVVVGAGALALSQSVGDGPASSVSGAVKGTQQQVRLAGAGAQRAAVSAGPSRGQPPKVSGPGSGTATVAIAPARIDFGATPFGHTAASQTVTLDDRGTTPVTIQAASLGGQDAGDFGIGSDQCSHHRLAAGAACGVSITFAPKGLGERTATLVVSSDGLRTMDVALAGEGTGTPRAVVTPAVVEVGGPQPTATLTNQGSAPLSVAAVALGGADANAFELLADQCRGQTIAPGATCTVMVGFQTKQPGQYTATLGFTDNADPSSQTVQVTGQNAGVGTASPSSTTQSKATPLG